MGRALLARVRETRPGYGILQTRTCQERDAARLCRREGWVELIRDSEFPVQPSHWPPAEQSNPRRVDDEAPGDYGEA